MKNYVNYISALSVLLPLLAGIRNFGDLTRDLKIFTGFFAFTALVELSVLMLANTGLNNLWVINLFALVEGLFFMFLIGHWSNQKQTMRMAVIFAGIYMILWLLTTGELGIRVFNTLEKTGKGILLIILSGYQLVQLSKNEEMVIYRHYKFWMLSAILVYFSVSFIAICTATILVEGHQQVMIYSWTIHSVANVLANTLFAAGFLWYYRKANSFT